MLTASRRDSGTTTLAGLDLLTASEAVADGVLHGLARRLSGLRYGSTHWARAGEVAHVSLSLELSGVAEDDLWRLLPSLLPAGSAVCVGDRYTGPDELSRLARDARDALAARHSGRLAYFPGIGRLVGSLPIRSALSATALDRVRVLASPDPDPDTVLVTRDHVRPMWSGGELVLLTQPAVGGTLVPYESPTPTACCADHA